MSRWAWAGTAIALVVSSASNAQNYILWQAPPTATGGQKMNLPTGTPLKLVTRSLISSKHNKPGDRLSFEVAEAVVFRGQTVIPAGAPATGEVVQMQRNGHFGKKGKLAVRFLHVDTPHGPVRLNGNVADEGRSGTVASLATMMFVSWLGFLIHGTSAEVAPGTVVTGVLADPLRFTSVPQDGDQALAMATPDPKPLPARFDPSVFGGKGPDFSQR